jgi:hypothetical protein
MKVIMMSLNQLFPTDEKIEEIKQLIRKRKWLPIKYRDFIIDDNNYLVYKPLDLVVVPQAEKEELLTELYKDDVNMLGKGVTNVYKYIKTRYINIKRKDVEEFLMKQQDYQLTKNIKKVVNKPIIEAIPNHRWQVDVIDMDKYSKNNGGRKYILNCVDVFSRKLWLRALKNLEAKTTTKAIKSIIDKAGIKPNIIQTDNGVEFQGKFKEFLDKNNITQIFNNAYSPNENAIVERSNKEVRKIIRTLMLAENSFKWYDKLDQVEEHRNNAYNNYIKTHPNEIWSSDKNKIEIYKGRKPTPKDNARKELVKRAMRTIEKYKQNDNYKVGDKIRIKMSAIFNNVRKLLKQKLTKQIVVSYTPSIFTINKVVKKDGLLERNKYLIENENGELVTKANGKKKYFYASDLLLYNNGEKSDLTMEDALKLNKVMTNENDAIF